MGRVWLDTTAAIFSRYVIMISVRCCEGKHLICFAGDAGTIKQRTLLFKLVILSVCKRHDGICWNSQRNWAKDNMFTCGKNLCASAAFYLNSQHVAWNSYWLQFEAVMLGDCLFWFPLAVKTKTPSGVCVWWTCDLSRKHSRLSLSGGCWERPGKAAFQKKETSFSWDARGELTHWGHLFSTVTNSSSTPMLTRPNFLKLPLSFTPLWIFNYADKELRKPLLIPLSLSLTARLRFLTCPTWELHLSPCT